MKMLNERLGVKDNKKAAGYKDQSEYDFKVGGNTVEEFGVGVFKKILDRG